MLGKLSIRNAKRQAKDYIIYFITVIISVALIFSFNSIAVSEDIKELSSVMENFSKSITGISIIVVLTIAWLINYTMKFMLEKRSKEFGTYEILGIEKKDISKMFTLENIIIGIIAFIIGVFFGIFLYQVLTLIIMNLFNQPYEIKITFSIMAVGMTAIYFFGIFLIVLLNCRRKIRKTKVYNLLYADKQNENNVIKNPKGNILIFIISIILIVCAVLINHKEFTDISDFTGRNMFIAITMLILGIYLFYISISSFIVKRYLDNKSRKYKKDNMFLYRNLTSKINTMSVTMGTIAFMFTIILIGGNVALLLNNMLNNEIEMGYPFEIMMSIPENDFSKYKEYINQNVKVKDMYEYRLYNVYNTNVRKALDDTVFEERCYDDIDKVMMFSDYNKLREMLGYEKVHLKDDEIIIQTLKTAEAAFKNYTNKNDKIKIADIEFKIKEIRTENLSQINFNGYTYIIIVPDNLIDIVKKQDSKIISKDTDNNSITNVEQDNEENNTKIGYFDFGYKLVVTTYETTDEKFYEELSELIEKKEIPMTSEVRGEDQQFNIQYPLGEVYTRGYRIGQVKSMYAIISFLAFYVALIFVMATATLLAIQQLNDSEKYKYRYELLKKLGMDELQMNRIILKQLFFYFALPMLLPFVVCIPVILSVGSIFTIAVTMKEIITNICIIYGLFVLVYGIYFIATDVQFTRNIEEIG